MINGALYVAGDVIDRLVEEAISNAPDTIPTSYFDTPKPYRLYLGGTQKDDLPSTDKLFSAGMGGDIDKGVLFVVVVWAAGEQFRRSQRLPPIQFHIPLSAKTDPDMDKSINSLLPGQFPSDPTIDLLDGITFSFQLAGEFGRAVDVASQMCSTNTDSPRGFLRLADAALKFERHKLAMLSYACAYSRSSEQKVADYILKRLHETSKSTEWGPILQGSELSELPSELSSRLLQPWSPELKMALSCSPDVVPTLCMEPRTIFTVPTPTSSKILYHKLPRFFRWLIPFHIAVMSTPKSREDIAALASPALGIRHVLTLTEEEPLPASWFKGQHISNTFLPVSNYHPPSVEQMDIVMRLFDDEEKLPLLIHCGGGKGRAGTVAACYLAAYGFNRPTLGQDHPSMTAADAISALRAIRPGSLETGRQEAFVSKWCSTIWHRQSIYPDIPSETIPCPPEFEGTIEDGSNLFVLVGLPGSGKSWFSRALVARDPKHWTRISQDESGSRSTSEGEISRTPLNRRVLLDRCNAAAEDRRHWLALASNWAVEPICIFFDYPKALCTSRAQRRIGHPTLTPGNRVTNAVEQMDRLMEQPTLKEGFAGIITIKSFAAAESLVARLSPRIDIFKFPRTPHLINLGAATSDDILAPSNLVVNSDDNVVITEKVDGANMGFSLSSDRSQILVQNRSHYVNPASHEQFKKLGLWVEQHRKDLFTVLDRDKVFPERYILFGEWLYATHSIPYTSLPDRFLAFDIYDRSTNSFASKQTLKYLLSQTTIQMTPVLHEGIVPSDEALVAMVQRPSQFYDGRVEGIYIQTERNGLVVSRGKVVRADFLAGNEHWSKGNLRVNGMARME